MPARAAAMTFSRMPPTGRTRPRRLISPVMAVVGGTARSVMSDASATNIATPADGPSLGVAPAGTWTWTSACGEQLGVDPHGQCARFQQAQGGLHTFLHHVAELPCQDQLARAGYPGRLNEQDVAADRRPGKARGDARNRRVLRHIGVEAARAKYGSDHVGVDGQHCLLPFGHPGPPHDGTSRRSRVPGSGHPLPACSRR